MQPLTDNDHSLKRDPVVIFKHDLTQNQGDGKSNK